jgi:carbon-monoxide dehydrogenase iron sulfur subunit
MIYAHPEKCSGCGRCEMACSFARTKTYSHSGSVIRLARDECVGLDFPVTCVQCYRCVAACPADALSITDEGLVKLDREICHPRTWAKIQGVKPSPNVYCGACEQVCPVGILEFDEHPAFCTSCGRCLEACNENALFSIEKPEMPELPSIEETEPLSPAERRLRWALKHVDMLHWTRR